jgi:hypothetical protein
MANEQNNSGFTLPTPADAASTASMANTIEQVPATDSIPTAADTSSRDMLIGGAVLLVLFVIFFFAKNGYANSLVAKRLPPNKANAAGWWLFLLLASLSTAIVLVVINTAKFLTLLVMGPLGAVSLLALILLLVSSSK